MLSVKGFPEALDYGLRICPVDEAREVPNFKSRVPLTLRILGACFKDGELVILGFILGALHDMSISSDEVTSVALQFGRSHD
jgi:hypothetical protein